MDNRDTAHLDRSSIIGGVFPLEPGASNNDRLQAAETLRSIWAANAKVSYSFHNARSAIRHIVSNLRYKRIWLPAYLCSEIPEALQQLSTDITYYPVNEELLADTEFLRNKLQSGDCLLAINYFGRMADDALYDLKSDFAGVDWIEDCAQCIHNSRPHFGDFQIYSPRKFAGIPDGGILVDVHGKLPEPMLQPANDTHFLKPYEMRADDVADEQNEIWFAAYQQAESAMQAGSDAMSPLAGKLLDTLDWQALAERRKRNYRFLLEALPGVAFFKDAPADWTPLGFPVRTSHSDKLWRHLQRNRVFAPRHWRDLPSSQSEFPDAHKLSREMLTIPCDQRYDEDDMLRIVSLVRDVLP